MHPATQPPPLPTDRRDAWTRATVNLLMWPGLGTWRREPVQGVAQMLLSAAGAAAALAGLLGWLATLLRTFAIPEWSGRDGRMLAGGMLIFALAWMWALVSSLRLIRTSPPAPARSDQAPGPPNPRRDP